MVEYIERDAIKAAVRKRLTNSLIISWLIRIINEIPAANVVPVVLPERYRVVASCNENGQFYSDLTGEEVANILNAYASGMWVPVVRCKDCKHCSDVTEYYADHKENKAHSKPGKACFIGLPRVVYPDDFCSRGERKDGDSSD